MKLDATIAAEPDLPDEPTKCKKRLAKFTKAHLVKMITGSMAKGTLEENMDLLLDEEGFNLGRNSMQLRNLLSLPDGPGKQLFIDYFNRNGKPGLATTLKTDPAALSRFLIIKTKPELEDLVKELGRPSLIIIIGFHMTTASWKDIEAAVCNKFDPKQLEENLAEEANEKNAKAKTAEKKAKADKAESEKKAKAADAAKEKAAEKKVKAAEALKKAEKSGDPKAIEKAKKAKEEATTKAEETRRKKKSTRRDRDEKHAKSEKAEKKKEKAEKAEVPKKDEPPSPSVAPSAEKVAKAAERLKKARGIVTPSGAPTTPDAEKKKKANLEKIQKSLTDVEGSFNGTNMTAVKEEAEELMKWERRYDSPDQIFTNCPKQQAAKAKNKTCTFSRAETNEWIRSLPDKNDNVTLAWLDANNAKTNDTQVHAVVAEAREKAATAKKKAALKRAEAEEAIGNATTKAVGNATVAAKAKAKAKEEEAIEAEKAALNAELNATKILRDVEEKQKNLTPWKHLFEKNMEKFVEQYWEEEMIPEMRFDEDGVPQGKMIPEMQFR